MHRNSSMKIEPYSQLLSSSPSDLGQDLHLWWAKANNKDKQALWKNYLSPDEIARSKRFKKQSSEAHFVAARGVLREIFGLVLGNISV
jgi:hypothetical protein